MNTSRIVTDAYIEALATNYAQNLAQVTAQRDELLAACKKSQGYLDELVDMGVIEPDSEIRTWLQDAISKAEQQ